MTDTARATQHVVSGLAPARKPYDKLFACIELDDRTYGRAVDCVHCGLCLPACPTYTENGLEADSPRGRICLIKGMADGEIEATESVVRHLDLCVGCQACETACPSGVAYHELIDECRRRLVRQHKPGLADRLLRAMFLNVFANPVTFKLVLLPVRILQRLDLWERLTSPRIAKLLPRQFEKMEQMLPPTGPLWESPLSGRYTATANRNDDGSAKAVVAYFTGCIGHVLHQDVNRQAVALLQHAGCDVVVPPGQVCCGAIHHHNEQTHRARQLLRQNVDAFTPDPDPSGAAPVDYVVNSIAGCGAALREAPHLLRDDSRYADRAETFASKVRDISEMLVELELEPPPNKVNKTITYHHACHLAHAQGVAEPPLALLRSIEGLDLLPLTEADMCCGAGGTYNLAQPAMARRLAERKIRHIQETGAPVCATGNIGCAMQIQSEADRLGVSLEVVHPVTLLHEAYFGAAACSQTAGA